jgi:hypothetical protein
MRRSLGAWAGVVGVVLPVLGLLFHPIWDFPGTASSGADVVEFVGDNRTSLQWVMVLNTIGVSLWMVFGAEAWSRLRRAAGEADPLTACFALGVTSFTTMLLAGFTCFDILVLRAPEPSTAALLYDLSFGLLAMSGMPTAVALGAYAWINARARVLPQSTSVLAGIAAAAHVLLLASFVVSDGFFSLEGQVITVIPALLFGWIFTTAVAMLRTDAPRDEDREPQRDVALSDGQPAS